MLTESQVEKSFRKLFTGGEVTPDLIDKAEELIDRHVRLESPLRHRLSEEIEELRSLCGADSN